MVHADDFIGKARAVVQEITEDIEGNPLKLRNPMPLAETLDLLKPLEDGKHVQIVMTEGVGKNRSKRYVRISLKHLPFVADGHEYENAWTDKPADVSPGAQVKFTLFGHSQQDDLRYCLQQIITLAGKDHDSLGAAGLLFERLGWNIEETLAYSDQARVLWTILDFLVNGDRGQIHIYAGSRWAAIGKLLGIRSLRELTKVRVASCCS